MVMDFGTEGVAANQEADERFERTCDWIETLLARLSPLPPPGPVRLPPEQAGDFGEEDAQPCWICGVETTRPLLCAACLGDRERLAAALPCPWLLGEDWCAAALELCNGELVETRCAGNLAACERRALLEAPGEVGR